MIAKNFQAIDQVRPLAMTDQEQTGSWVINDENMLLPHKTDWRNALPSLEEGRDYIFFDLPISHHEYNSQNYPYNLFTTPLETQRSVKLRPYGEYYGIYI